MTCNSDADCATGASCDTSTCLCQVGTVCSANTAATTGLDPVASCPCNQNLSQNIRPKKSNATQPTGYCMGCSKNSDCFPLDTCKDNACSYSSCTSRGDCSTTSNCNMKTGMCEACSSTSCYPGFCGANGACTQLCGTSSATTCTSGSTVPSTLPTCTAGAAGCTADATTDCTSGIFDATSGYCTECTTSAGSA